MLHFRISRPRAAFAGAPSANAWLALLFVACGGGQSGAELTSGPEDPGEPNPGGEVECSTDAECIEVVDDDVEQLGRAEALDVELSGSACELSGVILPDRSVSGTACQCELSGGGFRPIGPVGVGCFAMGRGGDCLWNDDEFAGCDVNDPNACSSACSELERRLEADARRTFQAERVSAACSDANCESVVSIEGRCYANRSYQGPSYDCALGAPAILEAHAAATTPEPPSVIPDGLTPFAIGTDAMLQLTVQRDYYGTAPQPLGFGAFAQFFTKIEGEGGQFGEVVDPLEGVDDCGVIRLGNQGFAPDLHLQSVSAATLRDGGSSYPLEEFRSSSDDFYSYVLSLHELGVEPRFGGSYGFEAQGGSFGGNFELSDVRLPAALSIAELERSSHFERGPLDLTWTGSGSEPLRFSLQIQPRLADLAESYGIECLVMDDGAFTLPAEVMAAAPDGFALLTATREHRSITRSAPHAIQVIASVMVNHRFWLGPSCDAANVAAACEASAAQILERYAECSVAELPPLETLCPDYLATSCGGCVEYFACRGNGTTCESGGLTTRAGCSCP